MCAQDSHRVIEELLQHTRQKHTSDVEELEKRWRLEQQTAFEMTQAVSYVYLRDGKDWMGFMCM